MAPEDINQSPAPAVVETPAAPAVEPTPVTEPATAPESAPVVLTEAPLLSADAPPAPVKPEAVPADVKTETAPAEKLETPLDEKPADKPVDAPKEDVKPAEDAKSTPEAIKPEDADVKTEVTALPVYDPIKLPDDVKLPVERISEIDSMFGNFEKISKADHAQTAQFRQAFVEYGLGVVKDALAEQAKQSTDYWATKEKEWQDQFERDPEYGGNRKDTTLAAAKQFIATHMGTPDQQKEFYQLLNDHKLANHPVMIRALANANLTRAEGRPLPGVKPVPQPVDKLTKWYGKS